MAIILALEEYKSAYDIALHIASCLDLSQIHGELTCSTSQRATPVSGQPHQDRAHNLTNCSTTTKKDGLRSSIQLLYIVVHWHLLWPCV